MIKTVVCAECLEEFTNPAIAATHMIMYGHCCPEEIWGDTNQIPDFTEAIKTAMEHPERAVPLGTSEDN